MTKGETTRTKIEKGIRHDPTIHDLDSRLDVIEIRLDKGIDLKLKKLEDDLSQFRTWIFRGIIGFMMVVLLSVFGTLGTFLIKFVLSHQGDH